MNYKIIPFLAAVITLVLFSACKDSADEPDSPTSQTVEYYVKYELKTSSKYIYQTVEASLLTEKGYVTMSIPRNWEGTFGPFKQLENLVFTIKCDPEYTYNSSTYNGRISICRGNQPYILKADKSISNAPLNMSYQVTSDDLK